MTGIEKLLFASRTRDIYISANLSATMHECYIINIFDRNSGKKYRGIIDVRLAKETCLPIDYYFENLLDEALKCFDEGDKISE